MSETKPSGAERWIADHRWVARGICDVFLAFAVASLVLDLVQGESRWWVPAGQVLLWTGLLMLHGVGTPKRVDKWRQEQVQPSAAAPD